MTENIELEDMQTNLVYAMACTSDLAYCFAATGSGLYRSGDAGETWQPAYATLDFSEPMPTTSVILSPDMKTESVVIAGVPGGILLSTDAGVNWQGSTLSSPSPMVSTMAISPNYIEDGVSFAGTSEDGVFRSANRGSNWGRWNFGLLDLTAFCLGISPQYAQDETLYVGVESGIFRSTNGGRAWRDVDLPVGYDPVLSIALSPDFINDGVILAGTETKGLLLSNDGGVSWERVAPEVISLSINSIILSKDYVQKPEILILHESTLLLSSDNGVTWKTVMDDDEDITAVLAPEGLGKNALLLVGLLDGTVKRLRL